MSDLQMAFGITAEDIENVLRDNAVSVTDSQGKPFDVMAEELFNDLFGNEALDRVAKAALDGGIHLEEQTVAAYQEIQSILVDHGVLKGKAKPALSIRT